MRRQILGQDSRGKVGMKERDLEQGRTMRMNLEHNEEVQLMAHYFRCGTGTEVWAWG